MKSTRCGAKVIIMLTLVLNSLAFRGHRNIDTKRLPNQLILVSEVFSTPFSFNGHKEKSKIGV